MQESPPESARETDEAAGRAGRRLPNWTKLLLRAAAAAVLVAFLARKLDWPVFLDLLARCDWWWGATRH